MKIPDMFRGDENFWELNPQYRYIFSDFYEADKTKTKDKSSRVMWALYFKLHPKSDFYNLADKDTIIVSKWIKDPGFKWSDYQAQIDRFNEVILTQAEKSLNAWNETMANRDKFIHSQEFTLDHYQVNSNGDNILSKTGKYIMEKGTADQLDRMLANTSKLYQEYTKIQAELAKDEIKRGKAGKPKSLSDAGEI